MAITIKDVAKMAGVSISTVSRVLNNSKPVSGDIRERVEEVIRETGYVPNPVARSLVMRKSRIIGVIVPNISNGRIGEYLSGIEEVGRMYQYDLFLCNSYGELKEEMKYVELLRSKQVAGMVFLSWKLQEKVVDLIKESKIPTVFVSKNTEEFEDIHSVGVDHFRAAYDMTNYLIGLGHKSIAFLRTSIEDDIKDSTVFKGYAKAHADNGLSLSMNYVLQGDASSDSGYHLAKQLIEMKEGRPTAIFASSDEAAAGALGAAIDTGLKVPDDISIAGYANTAITSLIRPALTTIHQPLYDIGAVSMRSLIKNIEGAQDVPETIRLAYSIVERSTTRALREDEK